ncbi:hypothetical protein KFL_001480250 [Klebsormidium nitens]|uniref:PLAC8 family protein n=1 Tax=Klebsormidium nitens TaxID=105231 RepID=A0A1Y1I3Z6_KLENI|nr:hypothetical protein KFL_001480250 [Klebsormidium nitens]|eukprot:GAQ83456.1 hypothetical protein KFL_001480250 [Klebsormidium nitens]
MAAPAATTAHVDNGIPQAIPVATPVDPMKVAAPPSGGDKNAALKEGLVQFVAPEPQKFGDIGRDIGPAIEGSIDVLKNLGNGASTGTKPWGTEFFAFWENPMICLWTCCCPCIIASRAMAFVSGQSCESHCLQGCIANAICLGPCYFTHQRSMLRKKYDLEGSNQLDCILACCCGGCLFCQQARWLNKNAGFAVPLA